MTTRINVTVGDGGLLERNAQQQAAKRQSFLLRAEREEDVANAKEELQRRRATEGLDGTTGEQLPAFTSRIERVDQDPAAHRYGGYPVLYAIEDGSFNILNVTNDAGLESYEFRPPLPDFGPPGVPSGTTGGSDEGFELSNPNPNPDTEYPTTPDYTYPYGTNPPEAPFAVPTFDWSSPSAPCYMPIDYIAWSTAPVITSNSWQRYVSRGGGPRTGTVILPYSSTAYIVAHVSDGWVFYTDEYTERSTLDSYYLTAGGVTSVSNCGYTPNIFYRASDKSVTNTYRADDDSQTYPFVMVCVIVGKYSQRQISAPPALAAAIIEYFTTGNYVSLARFTTSFLVGQNSTTTMRVNPSLEYYDFVTTTTNVYGERPSYDLTGTAPVSINAALHTRYKGNGAVTPSIYVLLRSTSFHNPRAITTVEQYESWYASHPYRYKGINSVDQTKIKIDQSKQGVPVTNWGATAYCREQLLALGFTAADLVL